MQWHPHSTVATVVEQDGRFLMVEERADERLVYNQPAGHLEAGETLQQAAVRETLEETAWQVELTALIGIYQYTSPHNGVCYLRSCFAASPLAQTSRPLDSDIVRALWMSEAQLRRCRAAHRSPMVLRVIEDYLAGQRHPLQLIQSIDIE